MNDNLEQRYSIDLLFEAMQPVMAESADPAYAVLLNSRCLAATRRCDRVALRFVLLRKAIGRHGPPEKITIDKSGALSSTGLVSCVHHDRRMQASGGATERGKPS